MRNQLSQVVGRIFALLADDEFSVWRKALGMKPITHSSFSEVPHDDRREAVKTAFLAVGANELGK